MTIYRKLNDKVWSDGSHFESEKEALKFVVFLIKLGYKAKDLKNDE